MKKSTRLWTIMFAFLFGQAIQLVTIALAHYLYVSDPVMLCIAVAIVTVALVVMTAIFTLMDSNNEYPVNGLHQRPGKDINRKTVEAILAGEPRPMLDTDEEDIDEIDRNNAEN